MKRFYKDVSVEAIDGDFRVTLDGRPIRTQGGAAQVVPTRTLAEGMVADLCVLEADPFELAPAQLPRVEVDLTVVGGEIVHERQAAPVR